MSKTVRTGPTRHAGTRTDRVGSPLASARREGAQAASGRGRSRQNTATGAARSEAGNIPSTLDPDLAQETDDIENELAQRDEDAHSPEEEETPEEEIADEVVRAAEALPADMPVDKADRTDEREENPPRPPRVD
ncbi:hypothetical protein [Cupriavidus taiwanensis]|uniref:hypothetical protein n=1 Tax=Cupriavidus taiwanensis TaxID=164546 RepID=UPI000E1084B7|nr:hypothetical protein [Cupriavidus taiwanensis]SPA34956.1 conserved hypothetical protein [Cupriavidus taiwanensis]SPA55810.1 conserved hypothetical protein [Cupriavidus taiwanensis]